MIKYHFILCTVLIKNVPIKLYRFEIYQCVFSDFSKIRARLLLKTSVRMENVNNYFVTNFISPSRPCRIFYSRFNDACTRFFFREIIQIRDEDGKYYRDCTDKEQCTVLKHLLRLRIYVMANLFSTAFI